MPFVKASQANSHLELIKNGTVRKISGFVPDDNGDFILVVFMNPTRMSKLNQSGLGFNADMMISGSSRPKKYGKLYGNLAEGVFVHLCTKKSCGSFQHAVHLGEWAYLEEGEEMGEVSRDSAGRDDHASQSESRSDAGERPSENAAWLGARSTASLPTEDWRELSEEVLVDGSWQEAATQRHGDVHATRDSRSEDQHQQSDNTKRDDDGHEDDGIVFLV